MKLIGMIILLASLSLGFAAEQTVPERLQDVSVMIKSATSAGSGVLFNRTNSAGEAVSFVWTAAHVIDDLKVEREIIADDGSRRTLVEFKDAIVIKTLIEDGRTVGTVTVDAEV